MDEKASGVGNAAKRVLAGGGTVTVEAGKVSYWIMVFVSISATIMGGSSCSKQKTSSAKPFCRGSGGSSWWHEK
jgi:hypothetical protein